MPLLTGSQPPVTSEWVSPSPALSIGSLRRSGNTDLCANAFIGMGVGGDSFDGIRLSDHVVLNQLEC